MFITYMVIDIVLAAWNYIPLCWNYYPLVVVGIIGISVVAAVLIWITSNYYVKFEWGEVFYMSVVVFCIDSVVMYYLYVI